jgi:N-acetylglucosamine-6-sulfatase
MRTRGLVATLAAASLVHVGSALASPNIVLIVTDDQRWDTVSAMPRVTQKLVNHGITFTNAVVSNSLCCPSRSSILTGRYSHSTRVYRNEPPLGGFVAFRDASTIATWLRRGAGYRTALVGKYLNGYVSNSYVPPGWTRWFAFTNLGYYTYGLNIDGNLSPNQARSVYSTDALAAEARRFIRASSRPFFLYFAPFAPHSPATPAKRHAYAFPDLEPWRPPSYNEEDVSDKPAWLRAHPPFVTGRGDRFRRKQLRTLLAVDEAVSGIVSTLARTGKLRNTIIVYTSDNGFMWGEHRLHGKGFAYEESIRVPFIVRYDRLVPAPRVEPSLVGNIDFAPTFAALAGVSAPGAEGRSLVPLLRSPTATSRKAFLLEHLRPPTASTIPFPTYCGLRTEPYSFVTYATGERELYDLVNDPYQLQSLARDPTFATTVADLRARLGRMCRPPPPGLRRSLLCTHAGTNGNDSLSGSRLYDIICAYAGDDTISAGAGPDWIFAGAGHDIVRTGTGDDHVMLRDGIRDAVNCGGGRDVVRADASDRLAECEVRL